MYKNIITKIVNDLNSSPQYPHTVFMGILSPENDLTITEYPVIAEAKLSQLLSIRLREEAVEASGELLFRERKFNPSDYNVDSRFLYAIWAVNIKSWKLFTQCEQCRQTIMCSAEDYLQGDIPWSKDINGRHYCADCAEEELHTCYFCDGLVHTDDSVWIHDEDVTVCENCAHRHYFQCEDCGDWVAVNAAGRNLGDHVLCQDCFDDHWYVCSECGDLVSDREVCWDRYGDAVCPDCYHETQDVIHSYGFKPELNFYSMPDEKPKYYLGFELESGGMDSCSDMEDIASFIKDEDYYVLKEDSSIPEYGFELVSMPMTLAFHKGFKWADTLKYMSKHGLRSHDCGEDECGLHVHVSRKALSQHGWLIVDWFVSKYQKQWEAIARRPECSWANFKKKRRGEKLSDRFGKKTGGRYQAVNFQNENTVEFRLFRGSLRYETLIATLEIVDALVQWASQVKAYDILRKDAFVLFVDYICKHEDKYTYAMDYLTARGVC